VPLAFLSPKIIQAIADGTGYVWREATYASLSIIARAITGTAWNGPRFFGLRIDKGTAVSRDPADAPPGAPKGRHLAEATADRREFLILAALLAYTSTSGSLTNPRVSGQSPSRITASAAPISSARPIRPDAGRRSRAPRSPSGQHGSS
jgi:Protein of unknown function (DUF2924)